MSTSSTGGTAPLYDIAVIGGGINGCGIARDAAGRGFSVVLAEMGDLACGTSSSSSKLIHGGLRYLEHFEFSFVRDALRERQLLWRSAPHIIRPVRFVLPHHQGMRPAWLLRLGLFLYDRIGGRQALPASTMLDLTRDAAGKPLKDRFTKAFEYSDCAVDDARLVVLNARAAADKGAVICTRTKLIEARREPDTWRISLQDAETGQLTHIRARALVNAGGPWVDDVIRTITGAAGAPAARDGAANVRLVQGAHIVVKKLYNHRRSYIFQNSDGRIVFAMPFERDFTLIGTTDLDFSGPPSKVQITEGESDYLCAAASAYFAEPVGPDDIIWSYAALRPLVDDGAGTAKDATRDCLLTLDTGRDDPRGGAPLLNVVGGKITTYRRLAESAMAKLEAELGRRGPPWTASASLPGGAMPGGDFALLCDEIGRRAPFFDPRQIERLAGSYGTDTYELLKGAGALSDLGRHFGADLYAREVDWMMQKEWARNAEDVIWRRSKLGLRLTIDQIAALDDWMAGAPRRATWAKSYGRRHEDC